MSRKAFILQLLKVGCGEIVNIYGLGSFHEVVVFQDPDMPSGTAISLPKSAFCFVL
jgi:hypothetical protein